MFAVQADGTRLRTVEGLAAGRRASPDPGRLLPGARPAVRLLHARHDDDGGRAAGAEPDADRAGDPRGDLRQPLPLHRATSTSSSPFSTPRQRDARRRANGRRSGRGEARCHDAHRIRGYWPQRQAQRRPALPARQGQLHRRHQAARACSTWTSSAAPSPTPRITNINTQPALDTPACWPSSPARISTRPAWPGCRR